MVNLYENHAFVFAQVLPGIGDGIALETWRMLRPGNSLFLLGVYL